jgi:hypothetical protein
LLLAKNAWQQRGFSIAKEPDFDAGMFFFESLNHLLAVFNRRRRVPNHFALSVGFLQILPEERADPERKAKEQTDSNAPSL